VEATGVADSNVAIPVVLKLSVSRPQIVVVCNSTSFNIYGEKYVSLNVTGISVIELEWDEQDALDLCHEYYDKKLLEEVHTGHLVVIGQSSSIINSTYLPSSS